MSKRTKRILVINAIRYLWTLQGNRIDGNPVSIRVFREGFPNSIVYINPYSHDFEIRPKCLTDAIVFALNNGWSPENNNSKIYITLEDDLFKVIEKNAKTNINN